MSSSDDVSKTPPPAIGNSGEGQPPLQSSATVENLMAATPSDQPPPTPNIVNVGSSYQLGQRAIKKLVATEDTYSYNRAKLSPKLFKGEPEKEVFAFVDNHVKTFFHLPQLVTLEVAYPEVKEVECPESAAYYLRHLQSRFAYERVDQARIEAYQQLKAHPYNPEKAEAVLATALKEITEQRYRHRILDFPKEGKHVVLQAYHGLGGSEKSPAYFGWPYLDDQGGILPGNIGSIVGRPEAGKSLLMLCVAAHNWREKHKSVLFVSMEMDCLEVGQRLAAMYAGTNLKQLRQGMYSSQTMGKFTQKLGKLEDEPAALYIVDGNLAASVEDAYTLANQLACEVLVIDGAYLLQHKDPRLLRFERVAENCSLMKRFATEHEVSTFCSWQFNRDAANSNLTKKVKPGLEHIGLSEAIGQISSIVLGIRDEEVAESRLIHVMKGRNGEIGEFHIHWNWDTMDFTQVGIVKPDDELLEKWQM